MIDKAEKGYYSLIQYCPDLGRLEAANVGVLLFCPERRYLKALTAKGNKRIIHFFGSEGHDWGRINAFKRGLEDRIQLENADIKTLDDLRRFIALRANILQLTDPRPMKLTDDPDAELLTLFKELAIGAVHKSSTKSFRKMVGDKFEAAGLEKKILKDVTVSVPVFQKKVEIPYGFQNGRFNLINPVKFEATDPELCQLTACKHAVEGKSLHDSPDPKLGPLQLIVVGKFRPNDHDTPVLVNRVFHDYGVKLFQVAELRKLIDEIRTTGKDIA
jgi:hypothetical protein